MTKRELFYDKIISAQELDKLERLPREELKHHVGDTLIFGYKVGDVFCNYQPSFLRNFNIEKLAYDDILCAWMGILYDADIDSASLLNTAFLYRDGKLLNVMKEKGGDLSKIFQFDNSFEPKRCNAQKFILIPNKQIIAYYNLIKVACSACSKK